MDDYQLNSRVLIICDDQDTGFTWASLLRSKGIDVTLSSGHFLGKTDEEAEPDLIIIDQTFSEGDELKLIKELKAAHASLIFYLTSQSQESHILEAYEAGVDDCYVKPISPALFLYKVRALLQRSHSTMVTGPETIKTSDLVLDVNRRVVIINPEKEVRLSQLEFRLLYCLIKSPGRVFTAEQLIICVWGYSGTGDQRLLKHLVFRLRQKLGDIPKNPKYIQTEAGIGYKLMVRVDSEIGSQVA